ncbi:hypothetical protein CTI12_AA067100 [Artemisia annua]|uniref:Reverse transcriptase zinc-binding domain-containing protein n=1 Tax=Artemisia annua TaxID=35608 RepID=A0A2U1Q463_ARTAN|nr:hypothetical protein CTI12_AA067100 [Artemisia annua]
MYWKFLQDKIPTRANPSNKGIITESVGCSLCDHHLVDTQHLFFECETAKHILSKALDWWGLIHPLELSIESLWLAARLSRSSEVIFDAIISVVIWAMWAFRNDTIFCNSSKLEIGLINKIQVLAFGWINNMGRKTNIVI